MLMKLFLKNTIFTFKKQQKDALYWILLLKFVIFCINEYVREIKKILTF